MLLESVHKSWRVMPEELPADYSLPDAIDPERRLLVGLCMPLMGMHAMPRHDLENSEPFRATMLIGYYSGNLIFVEPMVSRAMLMEEKSFSLDIPSLPSTEVVRYPARFAAEFDQSSRTYRMVFSEFAAR